MSKYRRTVSENGQVTIPKALRSRYEIDPGDTVVVRDRGGELVIQPPSDRDRLAEGYRARADRAAALAATFGGRVAEEPDPDDRRASPPESA